jgi:nitroreductase
LIPVLPLIVSPIDPQRRAMPEPLLPELYDALMTTRMMRRFSPEPVDDETVQAILAAAVQAPSGGNIQPYQFLVVTDPEKKERIGELYRKGWERYEPVMNRLTPPPKNEQAAAQKARNDAAATYLADNIASSPVLVFVLVPKISMAVEDEQGVMDVGPVYASVYPAVENLVLACRAFGLGTCLTTLHRIYEDEIRELLEIPERYEVVVLLPIGHPTGRFGTAARRPAASLTSWDTFGVRKA